MQTLFERSFLVGIGLLSMTRDKAQKIVDELTLRGEVEKDEAKGWIEKLTQRGEEERQSLRRLVHDEVKNVLDGMGLATKQDIQDLAARIDAPGRRGKA
jgi:polyhydroxyalkanoate synthesis regulator phasin